MEKNTSLAKEICKIEIIETRFVSNFARGTDKHHVVLATSQNFETIYHTPGTVEFTEDEKISAQGSFFDQAINITIPGKYEGNREFYSALNLKRLLLKLTFSDNKCLLIGTKTNPVVGSSAYNQARKAHYVKFLRSGSKGLWVQ